MKALTYFEMDIDYCENTYGLAPCQALLVGDVTHAGINHEFQDSAGNGWLSSGGTLTTGADYMSFNQNGSDPQIYVTGLSFSGSSYRYIVLDIERQSGAGTGWDGTIYYTTGGHGHSGSFNKILTAAEHSLLDAGGRVQLTFDMSVLNSGGTDWITNTITGIRFDFNTGSDGGILRIYSVRVGAIATSVEETGTHKCFNCIASCQDSANYIEEGATLRFAQNADYLPIDIDAVPNIKSVDFTPGTISLGDDLGQRSSLKVTFNDHPHPDTGTGYDKYYSERGYDAYQRGSHWGRFRTRHPYMQSRDCRLIRGLVGDAIEDMETRHYIIDSIGDQNYDGEFSLTAKDILKLADGDKSQAPLLSEGVLDDDITISATIMYLSPAGIGADYGNSGYINIGDEIVSFTRDVVADLLIHADTGSSPTNFVDVISNRAITIGGNAQISSAQFKWGTASGLFDGTGDYIQCASNAIFQFGTSDFSVDFQMRLTAFQTFGNAIIDFRNAADADAGLNIWIGTAGAPDIQVFIGTTIILDSANFLTTGAWYHVMVTRKSGVMYLIVNGSVLVSAASTHNFTVGRARFGMNWTSTTGHNGYLDEIRTKKGLGYSTFAAPTAAYSGTERGDGLTITRAQLGTTAAAQQADDRAQTVLRYSAQDPANIVYDLLLNYAGVSADYLPLADWLNETQNFSGNVYSANIPNPVAVSELLSELINIVPMAIWWDDREQVVRLQVLRQISTDATRFTADDRIKETLTVKEQMARRLTQVWTYLAPSNPLEQADKLDNYQSVAKTVDATAEANYGVPAILKRNTRWIPQGGLAIAETSNEVLLSRYVNPPRRVSFSLPREYSALQDPTLGGGYQLEAWIFQDETGDLEDLPIQITRINALSDRFDIEAEEMRFQAIATQARIIILDVNQYNVNLRTLHDSLYTAASSGDTVTIYINDGVIIGSVTTALKALDVGTWPAGVSIHIYWNGRVQGAGGEGGYPGFEGDDVSPGTAGLPGGTAFYTRKAVTMHYGVNAECFGGGGGGGGGQGFTAGPGSRGGGGQGSVPANSATTEAPGPSVVGPSGSASGAGGGPGAAGATAPGPAAGGAAGAAIDGASYISVVSGFALDVRGTAVN